MGNNKTVDLTELVDQYTDDLYSWAFYKVSDAEVAKDLVQDTFLAAAEKISSFKGKSSSKTWLFAILKNKITDYYRKKVIQSVSVDQEHFSSYFNEKGDWRREKMPKDWQEKEEHLLDDINFQRLLEECLNALPESWNTAVKLKYLLSKKGEEICQELDISPTNYWQIIHRAKLQLRDCIEVNWIKD